MMTADEQLHQDAMRAVDLMLVRAKEMSTLYHTLLINTTGVKNEKFIQFGIKINYELLNAIGDVMNNHDAHDENDPDGKFIDSVFARLHERFPEKDHD